MADDGEWHTVTSNKHTISSPAVAATPSNNNNNSQQNARRKSRHRIHTPKQAAASSSSTQKRHQHSHTKEKKTATSTPAPVTTEATTTTANPFHSIDEDDSEGEEENDGQVDPIDLPVPPYHTSIMISCPLQDCESPMPFLDTTSLVKHLKEQHKLAFKNLHHMYMALDAYLARWAKELNKASITEFGQLDTQEKDVYVIDPEKCALDKEIREEMQRAKLNEVLKTQQNERETDSKSPRKCLFCKIICENRAVLFKHMFAEHNFNIGLPDNLVHVNEFLDTLEAKLSNLQCLYCEKTFTSPAVLRKHMRKKKHFKIASKNRQYDRFYVINYLEPGKNWESFENDNYESDDDKRGGAEESWADWEEDIQESTMCLFDTLVLNSPTEALAHMKSTHQFDLTQLRKDKSLDFYQIITLINYIRHQNSLGTCFSCGKNVENENELASHLAQSDCIKTFVPMDAPFWKDPKYLIPTYENDPLLTGFEENDDDEEDDLDLLSDDEANKKYLHQVMERSLSISEEGGVGLKKK